MMSFNGSILRDSRILARPSAFGERSFEKREKKDVVLGSDEKLV